MFTNWNSSVGKASYTELVVEHPAIVLVKPVYNSNFQALPIINKAVLLSLTILASTCTTS